MNGFDNDFYKKDRKKYSESIITSPSRRKVIIAGPGTGKTYIFKSLFRKVKDAFGEEGLALTFIRNLVADLRIDLAGLAKVSTFHSYCKSIVHSFNNEAFEYYPKILKLIEQDINILEPGWEFDEDVERCFFGLKNDEVIKFTIKIGDYYNAAGHSDSVYRVIKHYEAQPSRIQSYPLIVFDEYQDFNFLETSLVDVLSSKSPGLIVGDDDQALYGFKQASPNYIRRLYNDPKYQRFELPYCSRCTKVIVDAVNKIICIAKENGRLDGRVDKQFIYFPPAKEKDSKRHPDIINVNCTVERKDCHYMGKFIAKEISGIPVSYVHESYKLKEPAVLIIGPGHFLEGVKKELNKSFGYTAEKRQGDEGINILDGYRSIAKNATTRLGWRILLHCDPCTNSSKIVHNAISGKREIIDLIPSKKYISKHQKITDLVKMILCGTALSGIGQRSIEASLGLPLSEIEARLLIDTEEPIAQKQNMGQGPDKPHILCTSFEGAKGLAAQYVFIVGVNEKHFPQKAPPGDRDIYRLIVALTRTRKKCYMISCKSFGGVMLNPSIFKSWLKSELSEEIYVDKHFVTKYCA